MRMVSDGKKPQLELPRQLMPSVLAKGAAARAASKLGTVKRMALAVYFLRIERCFDTRWLGVQAFEIKGAFQFSDLGSLPFLWTVGHNLGSRYLLLREVSICRLSACCGTSSAGFR